MTSCLVFFYRFQYGRCNFSYYGETNRDLKVSFGNHIVISPLTFNKVKLLVASSVSAASYFVVILLLLKISSFSLMEPASFCQKPKKAY